MNPALMPSRPSISSKYSAVVFQFHGTPVAQRLERHALDARQHAHEVVAVGGVVRQRRDGEAAVAGERGGDAVQRRRRERAVPEHLRVVVRVHVDEAGRDDLAGGVDGDRGLVGDARRSRPRGRPGCRRRRAAGRCRCRRPGRHLGSGCRTCLRSSRSGFVEHRAGLGAHRTVGRMDLSQGLRSTGAVRDFRPEPVPDDVLHRLLDTARFAPNGGNRQAWHVIVVRDPAVRLALRDLYLPGWYEYLPQMEAGLTPFARGHRPRRRRRTRAPGRRSSRRAARRRRASPRTSTRCPLLLVLLADLRNLATLDRDLDRYTLVGGASIYPFAWSLLLAAHDAGLGGVFTTVAIRAGARAARAVRPPRAGGRRRACSRSATRRASGPPSCAATRSSRSRPSTATTAAGHGQLSRPIRPGADLPVHDREPPVG